MALERMPRMPHRSNRRIAFYMGVYVASLVLAVALIAALAVLDAPEEIAILYLEPGSYADALLSKTGPLYTALLGSLDHIFSGKSLFGLPLSSSIVWLPVALAFVVWACLFSVLAILLRHLFTRRAPNASNPSLHRIAFGNQ
jgi:hypothetical protein